MKIIESKHLHYSGIQIALHWLSAIMIIFVILLALARGFWAPIVGGMGNVFMLHKSFGVLIFAITLIRIIINLKLGAPDVLPADARLTKIAAKSVQGLLYLLLLILPISGFLMSRNPINFFAVWQIPVIEFAGLVSQYAHKIHIWGGLFITGLILLHTIAALFHHYVKKDNVLNSMRPTRKR